MTDFMENMLHHTKYEHAPDGELVHTEVLKSKNDKQF